MTSSMQENLWFSLHVLHERYPYPSICQNNKRYSFFLNIDKNISEIENSRDCGHSFYLYA